MLTSLDQIEYDYGDIVYLKTDPEQLPRIVIGAVLRPQAVAYDLACGTIVSTHYSFEVTETENVLLKIKNHN